MPPFGVTWAERLRAIESWLLPAACLGCGDPVLDPAEPLACALCTTRWRPIPAPTCPRCGQPILLGLACRLCADWPRDFGPVRSAVLLDDRSRRLLHRFKYGGWRRLAEVMAQAMMSPLGEVGEGILVPIPTTRQRRHRRGYNQAEVLATALGSRAGRPCRPGLLRRVRAVGSQTRLGAADRKANLGGVFAAAPWSGPVILVDDVFTTGATLVSAARACLDAGVDRVAAVTFARAGPPLAAAARRLSTTDLLGSSRS